MVKRKRNGTTEPPFQLSDFRKGGIYHGLLPCEAQDMLKQAVRDEEEGRKKFALQIAIDRCKEKFARYFRNAN